MTEFIQFICGESTSFNMENIISFFVFCVILSFIGNLIDSVIKGVR